MHDLLEFARGPLFRLTFLIMILGLLRLFVLSLIGIVQMVNRARDRNNNYGKILFKTFMWLFPFRRLHRNIPLTSYSSFVFHIGLVLVPLLLLDHISLWRSFLGFGWPGIPKTVADILTLLCLASGAFLLGFRIFTRAMRRNSGFVDYLLMVLLLLIFASGYLSSRPYNPIPYEATMLVHVLSADLLFLLAPFTKIAHCVLFPLVRMTTELAWKFPPEAGRNVTVQVHGEVKPI